MLEAMRAARFAILIFGRGHEAAGVIATDLFRRTDVWHVDMGLEASLEEGAMKATQALYPEQFSMTAGVNVPFDLALIEDLYDALQRVRDPTAWLPNPRTNYLFEVPCKFPLFWVSALENIRV